MNLWPIERRLSGYDLDSRSWPIVACRAVNAHGLTSVSLEVEPQRLIRLDFRVGLIRRMQEQPRLKLHVDAHVFGNPAQTLRVQTGDLNVQGVRR